jgi:ribosomal protein S18 acetylase RimI-like enzyme
MSTAGISAAGPADLEDLMTWREEVLREVFSIPESEPMDELLAANRAYYRAALADGSHIACFARIGSEIVGCGGACLQREMPSPDNPDGICAYLVNIYTRPQFRGLGVGRETVCWLIDRAKSAGAGKIYLEASENGRALYSKIGFSDMDGYMKLEK